MANKQRTPIDTIILECDKRNYKFLGFVENAKRTRIKYTCLFHEDKFQEIDLSSFNQGHGCKYCHYDKIKKEGHHSWKGGVTPLHNHLREHILDWKNDSKHFWKSRCILTNKRTDVIHHLYGFDLILQELIFCLDLEENNKLRNCNVEEFPQDELVLIREKFLELHYKYGLGVVLSKPLHKLFHKQYKYGNNLPTQFLEFYYNLTQGKYNDYLQENNITLNINPKLEQFLINTNIKFESLNNKEAS